MPNSERMPNVDLRELQSHACACCRCPLGDEPAHAHEGWLLCRDCYDDVQVQLEQSARPEVARFLVRCDRPSWDEHFLELAAHAATRSKDPSTQVGAVLVRDRSVFATGYNGFPRGVPDDYREGDRPIPKDRKYRMTIHAELNALLSAAREGVVTRGATLYVTPLFPCAQCAGALIQAGVTRVVTDQKADVERWSAHFADARCMFEAAGVTVETL